MAKRDYDYLLKVVVIGDTGVGKSCILMRYADDEFIESFISTIGVDFRFRTIQVLDKQIKIQIWDSAGQEKFRVITSAYYRSSDAIVVVYDVTLRESFERVKTWITDVHRYTQDVQIMIVANKCDRVDRCVSTQEGMALANELGAEFIETSAKTGENINQAFENLAIRCLQSRTQPTETTTLVPKSKSFVSRFCPKWRLGMGKAHP